MEKERIKELEKQVKSLKENLKDVTDELDEVRNHLEEKEQEVYKMEDAFEAFEDFKPETLQDQMKLKEVAKIYKGLSLFKVEEIVKDLGLEDVIV